MELKPLPSIVFLSTIFIFLLSSTRPEQGPPQDPQELSSFYEVLKSYGLPPGLLSGIKEYKLNDNTGKFKVRLKQKCKFSCGTYHLKYKKKIKGHIQKGELTDLKGIKVKAGDDWERIKRIRRTRKHDDDDNSSNKNGTKVDTKKKHDYLLFMGKEVTYRMPSKRFNRCPTCVHDDPMLNV